MRLMLPSPGEAYDRLTILNLKIKFARENKRENVIDGFVAEQKALVEYMTSKNYVVPTDLANEMGRINARLWDLEDRQRLLIKDIESQFVKEQSSVFDEFTTNAITIIRLNDARAEAVQKINRACGINAPEKLYGTNENSTR